MPNSAPRARLLRSGNHLSKIPPSNAPNTPVNITNTAVSSGTPPKFCASGMANGVVMERGTNDIVSAVSSDSALANQNELPMDAALPASIPSNKATQCRASNLRCCQIGHFVRTLPHPLWDPSPRS